MVVVPISADQPYSAERCADLGVGVTVASGDRSAHAIQDAVRRVLGEAGYRTTARDFQAEMAARTGADGRAAGRAHAVTRRSNGWRTRPAGTDPNEEAQQDSCR
jgi:UDP:flavonoid glycosyltransferase YjiC (YdhE family)